MWFANVYITGASTEATMALLDTGFTGGLWLPRSMAQDLGATLVTPARYPRAVDGRVLRGRGTILRVRLADADIERETIAFCPSTPDELIMLGAFFLASVKATIVVGKTKYKPVEVATPNRPMHPLDFGDWVFPTNRPVNEWWRR